MDAVFRTDLTVPESAVDVNRHVNNVAYVQWMQDAATAHAAATGCTSHTRAVHATWVARSHKIEYLAPAHAGDPIQVLTWVCDFRKVRSLRKYKFIRITDRVVLARGETVWVFVDIRSGRPRSAPPEILALFQLLPPDCDPD